jgi:ATP-binding cassette subfamily F protein uup
VIGYMKDFLFGPEQARTPIETLSGGEALAIALAAPSNLLALDEPTNGLNVETLDLMQALLGEYKGTILLVSQDRDFLDRVANSVVAGEGGGRWREYTGGYSDSVAQRGCGLAGPLAAPPAAAEKQETRPRSDSPAKRRLPFSEKRALGLLPARRDGLRAQLDPLEAKLADPAFAARDPASFPVAQADAV